MEWNEDTSGRLRALWIEGHSTAEIGRRLDVSKNAVIGKAHRLDLPARPSPIRRRDPNLPPARPRARRVVGPTLLQCPSTSALPLPSAPVAVAVLTHFVSQEKAVVSAPVLPPVQESARTVVEFKVPSAEPRTTGTVNQGTVEVCCWPLTHSKRLKPTLWMYLCGKDAVADESYCRTHGKLIADSWRLKSRENVLSR